MKFKLLIVALSFSSTAYSQDINYTSTTGNQYLSGVNGVVTLYQDPGTNVVNTYTDVGTITNSGILNGAILLNNTPINLILNNVGARLSGSTSIFLGNGSGTLGTGSLVTSTYNYGFIGGSSSTDYGIYLLAPDSKITTLNNYSGATIQGGTGIQNAGTITAISNSGTIKTYAAGAGAIVNTGSIGSISNSGIINATSAASGNAINNSGSGVIDSITNLSGGSISVSNGTSITLPAIYNAGTISTISNFGAINAYSNTRPGIENTGTITTLNNSQGDNFNGNNWLTYKGVLPTNYNIIINSTASYGQLFGTGGITGTTAFGIYSAQNISTSSVYRGVLINTGDTNISASTRSGIYDGYTWSLFRETPTSPLWDLSFSGVSASQTQAALVQTTTALQGVYALQTGTVNNSLTYDCNNFGAKGFCVSTGGRYSNASESTANTTSAMIIAGYRINDHLRIGASADQNLYNTDVAQIASVRSNTPLMGAFVVWNQNADKTGLETKVAASYNNSDLNVNRVAVGTSEAGQGRTALNTLSESITASYAFKLGENYRLSPYAGVRHTTVSANGYTEQGTTNVTAPLSYNGLNQESTSALLGLRLAGQVYKNTTVQTSAGFEEDMQNAVNNYSATGITGLSAITFNPNIQRTRAVVNFGASYELAKGDHLGFNTIYRQESFQGVDTKMAYVNYTMGF